MYELKELLYPDKCIRYSGKELDDLGIDGALIVESKDLLDRAEKKMSFNFNVYQEEFQRILYYEELPNGLATKNRTKS